MTTTQTETTPAAEEIVWGAEEIGKIINRTTKATYGALESGKVRGARKVAGRWAFRPRVWLADFEA
jgi:hypothetical protein